MKKTLNNKRPIIQRDDGFCMKSEKHRHGMTCSLESWLFFQYNFKDAKIPKE